MKGHDYCWHHAPELAADRARAHSAGGRARHARRLAGAGEPPPAALRTAGDALEALEFALRVAFALEPSHSQVRSIVAVVTAWRTVNEASELAARVEALETATFGPQGR